MEGLISIKKTAENDGTLVEPVRLSEQHLIDCARTGAANVSKDYGNTGCDGGFLENYADFVITEGVVTYDSYRPYENADGECEHNPDDVVENAFEQGRITTSLADAIQQLQKGPMPVSITAGIAAFMQYKEGILTAAECPGNYYHDHAVTIVGYGVENVETVSEPKTTCRYA